MNKLALISSGNAIVGNGSRRGVDDGPDRGPQYFAFLSYSHADSGDADWLQQAIERFAVPKSLVGRMAAHGAVPSRLTPIFRDRHELAASSDLGQTIRAAIRQSRFLIVLCSPAAAASRWVNEEILAFKKLHGEKRILAAIVGGEPWASEIQGRAAEECFPPALREKYDRKGHGTGRRAEPIAADLRTTGDGREAGKLKLVAGLLGLGLDELVRREQQRRQKRLTYIAAASIAGMAVTSGLAIFAFDKRDEARDQRREAEGLVGFMLGDLRDELEPIGKLAALDAVGSRALAYFEKQNKTELSDAALAQRSKALALLGEIATARRDLPGAWARYREAMAGTAEMIRRQPDDPQRLFDHAQNVFYLSQVETNLGRDQAAAGHLRDYKALADQMVAIDPGNRKWQTEVGYADTNLGMSLLQHHRYAEAGRQFASGLQIVEALNRSDPSGGDDKSLSEALAWLADSRFYENRMAEAIALRARQVAILNPKVAQGNDVQYREQAIPGLRALGRMLAASGNVPDGLMQSRRAAALAEQLMPTEPANMNWVELAAGAQLDLSAVLLAAGSFDDAAAATQRGCMLGDRLGQKGTSTPVRRELAVTCLMRGTELALARKSPAAALDLARRAIVAARHVQSPDEARNRYLLASGYKAMGDALVAMGDPSAAANAWRTALASWPAIAMGPRASKLKANLWRSLGQREEAAAIERSLAAGGYRILI